MNQSERRIFLIETLLKERGEYGRMQITSDSNGQRQLLRGLMNIREPGEVPADVLKIQDEYLTAEAGKKQKVTLDTLTPIRDGIYLWQGDITRLAVDAIVNAANSGMTGCYIPNHRCIDNCIHTYAGMQLRAECEKMMQRQGYAEPTGRAKITRAYNLPCKYILHTVGPIVGGRLTEWECQLLASCYQSCLELAAENQLESVAFCCISTGEFHFPNDKAAEIAVQTVTDFMKKETSVKKVIFNVFKDMDREIYRELLR